MKTLRALLPFVVVMVVVALVTGVASLGISSLPGVDQAPAAAAAVASTDYQMGIHVNDLDNSPEGISAFKEKLLRRELGSGRRLDLIATRPYGFSSPMPTWREPWIRTFGSTPVVNWEVGYTPAIESGSKDAIIRAAADGLKSLGARVVMRFAPGVDSEPRSTVTSVSSFVNSWRRVHNIFVARGATKVEWVFCPSATAWKTGTAMRWYPGAAYVDWVCAQGVNTGSPWTGFVAQFTPFYNAAGSLGKPLMVGSFGSVEGTSNQKAQWITAAYKSLSTTLPNIRAAIYEDTGPPALSTGAPALAAWSAAVSAPPLYQPIVPHLATGKLVPARGAYLGALLRKAKKADEQKQWNDLVKLSGQTLGIAHTLYAWGQTFPTWRESWHRAKGRIPMISWGGTDTNKINSGAYDTYIANEARAIKAFGSQVFIRWFWEMDGGFFAPQVRNPAAFKKAWARIHNIFVNQGATNAVWVWAPTAYGVYTGAAQAFYPGSALVDWIGGDGFNWYPQKDGSHYESFGLTFLPWYEWAAAQGKPLMAAALGSLETGNWPDKASWLTDMGNTAKVLFPELRAIVYYNASGPSYYPSEGIYHMELTTSPAAGNAWTRVASDPYFEH